MRSGGRRQKIGALREASDFPSKVADTSSPSKAAPSGSATVAIFSKDGTRSKAAKTELSFAVPAFVASTHFGPHTINGERMPTYMRWLAITYALTTAIPTAAVIPCGVDHAGMPFGLQIVGPNGSDATVLAVAHALEQVLAENPSTARPLPDIGALTRS